MILWMLSWDYKSTLLIYMYMKKKIDWNMYELTKASEIYFIDISYIIIDIIVVGRYEIEI